MQTTEENEVRTTERPSCWQEPEEEVYWMCWIQARANVDVSQIPTSIFRSEAEATLHGAQNPIAVRTLWACPFTLQGAIATARASGRPSLRLLTYENGKWVVLREYPVHGSPPSK